ncbi:MAG: sialidase family protein [Acidobacteria bacterium]|nr:sialidase family protein [Acidobacteriota bacterium]MDA1233738.1 sialidase family protein [Acidobacteriota bacterium]
MFVLAALAILHFAPASADTPARTPQLAASENIVALAYGSSKSIYVAVSSNQGKDFAKPVKVAQAAILPLTRHRGPRIAISNGSIIVTAVTGKTEASGPHAHGLPSDGDLVAWRSTDDGKTWSAPARVNDVPAAPREGLHTLTADGNGRLFAAWLDLRDEGTRLYGAWSEDGGATWSANVQLYESPDGTICQCCHPTAAFGPDGALDVMFRNALGGARDLYLLQAAAGRRSFGKPQKLGQGTWMLNACPMDGGGIAHDAGLTVTAWRRDREIFLAEPGKPETRLGEGQDVAVAASHGRTYAVWVQHSSLVSWVDGRTATIAHKAAMPALIALPTRGVLAAWEQDGGIAAQSLP